MNLNNILLILISGLLPLLFSCSKDEFIPDSPDENFASPVTVDWRAEGGAFNLSVPVIWADRGPMALPGEFGQESWGGSFFTAPGGEQFFFQGDPLNVWRASTYHPSGNMPPVEEVDWSNNLENRSWCMIANVPVEVTLWTSLGAGYVHEAPAGAAEVAYEMLYENGESGQGTVGGTNSGRKLSPAKATVHATDVRLVIQKMIDGLEALPSDVPAGITWNAGQGAWNSRFSPMVSEAFAGGVSRKGVVGYSYYWVLKQRGWTPGIYRITLVPGPNSNIDLRSAEVGHQPGNPGEDGGIASFDPVNNLAFIDVKIGVKHSGGQGSGGGGDSGGGCGGDHEDGGGCNGGSGGSGGGGHDGGSGGGGHDGGSGGGGHDGGSGGGGHDGGSGGGGDTPGGPREGSTVTTPTATPSPQRTPTSPTTPTSETPTPAPTRSRSGG